MSLYEAFVTLTGDTLSEATYIVVEEMPANSWGGAEELPKKCGNR